MLKKNDFRILDTIAYPDHYNYSKSDIKKILDIAKLKKAKIITTEKDYIKIAEEYKNEIKAIVFKSIAALKKPSDAIDKSNKIWKTISHPRRRPIKILYRSNIGAHINFQVKGS